MARPTTGPSTAPSPSPLAAFAVVNPLPAAAPAAVALAADKTVTGNAASTPAVNAAPGRERASVDSTTVASPSRSIARPRDSRCFTVSSDKSSCAATSAMDCCSR